MRRHGAARRAAPAARRAARPAVATAVATALAALVLGTAVAAEPILRVGVVVPTYTPGRLVAASLYDIVGRAARQGALQAEEDVGTTRDDGGVTLDVKVASAPNAEAAVRAAERLLATEDVQALLGGIGAGEAEALAQVAEDHGVPFLNIGSPSLALRAECRPTSFHVEASAGMYLDAVTSWFAGGESPRSRWFVLAYDTDAGRALRQRARVALAKLSPGLEPVGSALVAPNTADYREALAGVRSSGADVVLALLDSVDQIAFTAQLESAGPSVTVAAYPDPVTQTRDFMAASRSRAAAAGSNDRVVLWDTTLSGAAGPVNDRYTTRWGDPMDPSAWAAYEAVTMVHAAAVRAGATDGSALVAALSSPDATFDVGKGIPVSFRSWNHQLRQPLYAVRIDPQARWGLALSQQTALAAVEARLPPGDAGTTAALDRLGDDASSFHCAP